MENEFFKAIQYGNDPIVYYQFKKRYIKANDVISYEGLDESVKTFKFNNTLFKEDLSFKRIFFNDFEYHFSNCEFESFNCIGLQNISFTIRKSKFSDNLISFLHCDGIKLINNSSLSNINLSLLNCDNFDLEMINTVPIDISVSDSSFNKFLICNIHEKSDLIFNSDKSKFLELEILGFNISKFIFTSSDFVSLRLEKVKCDDVILINLVDKEVKDINISGSSFSNLCFSGGYEEYLVDLVEEFVVGQIEYLNIYNSTNIDFKYININNVTARGDYNSNVRISYCSINSLHFENFNCLNSFRIESLKKVELEKFSIIDSNLRNVEIIPSFFHYVKSFAFNNSSILGVKLIGFEKIPESVIEESEDMSILQKIDFTRELSALMIEQNNHYLTTVYRALEQDFRLYSMQNRFSMDYIILTLNSLSNSHGTRPEKSFILMLFIILIHFLVMRIEFVIYDDRLLASDFFWNNISYYFKPFTFISEIEYKLYSFSKYFIFFDFLYKLSFAYLLYQFVAAFRKFNK